LLFETQETSDLMTIDVSQLRQGVYFLKINDTLTKKLIVQ
jgi:hypothetical protein